MSGDVLRIELALPPSPCPYLLGEGALAQLGAETARVSSSPRCALVTDLGIAGTPHLPAALASLGEAGLDPQVHVLPAGEAAKTLEEAGRLWQFFAEARIERRSAVVALGGGAVGDAAGFCAATWMRGVPLVHVPTTLLAMADSSVGGKTAIDLAAGKNLVGAVHPPAAIVADLATLTTLPAREYASGFAEIVKCAVLADRARLTSLRSGAPALAARGAAPLAASASGPEGASASGLLADAIAFAVRTKEAHVAGDLLDLSGRRALLNLGHTVAHALETESGYGTMLHGEAVSVGTLVALRIAVTRGLVGEDLFAATRDALAAFGLPLVVPEALSPSDVVARTASDKKREGARRRMVLPTADGAALFDVADAELAAAIRASR